MQQITWSISAKLMLVGLLLTSSHYLFAQASTKVGFLPAINFNQKLSSKWDANLKYESRHFIYSKSDSESGEFEYDYALSDFSALMARKVGLRSKLVGGLLVRVEPDVVAYRAIQQFIFQSRIESIRLAHRIAADQSFSPDENPLFRLRYRAIAEIPLSGLRVDVKEFYFKFNAEMLNKVQSDDYRLEFRAVPNVGFVINDEQKIEVGLDNRFDSVNENKIQFTSLLSINWYL